MAPTGAALVTVGIKAVVLTHGRKLGIHDIIRVDTDIYQRLANGRGKIEHARGTRIDARELGGKAIHEFLGYLIFVTQDMGADIGGNAARIATGSIAKRLARLGGNACNRALPTGVHPVSYTHLGIVHEVLDELEILGLELLTRSLETIDLLELSLLFGQKMCIRDRRFSS